jgi:hypothetical protein
MINGDMKSNSKEDRINGDMKSNQQELIINGYNKIKFPIRNDKWRYEIKVPRR